MLSTVAGLLWAESTTVDIMLLQWCVVRTVVYSVARHMVDYVPACAMNWQKITVEEPCSNAACRSDTLCMWWEKEARCGMGWLKALHLGLLLSNLAQLFLHMLPLLLCRWWWQLWALWAVGFWWIDAWLGWKYEQQVATRVCLCICSWGDKFAVRSCVVWEHRQMWKLTESSCNC